MSGRQTTTNGFLAAERELNAAEQAHMKAVKSVGDQMLSVLKGNRPDPSCMLESIKKLEECIMWAEKGIKKGHPL